jgi:hypothetical protein
MGIKANIRALEAARKRELREAQKRQRELERLAKQQVKLSAIEQARLEVETHENRLEVLLSTHKEQIDKLSRHLWLLYARKNTRTMNSRQNRILLFQRISKIVMNSL